MSFGRLSACTAGILASAVFAAGNQPTPRPSFQQGVDAREARPPRLDGEAEALHHLNDPHLEYWKQFLKGPCPPALISFVGKLKQAALKEDPGLLSSLVRFPARVDDGSGSRFMNKKEFLACYPRLMTPELKSMVYRLDAADMKEYPDSTWCIFAGYGDIWAEWIEKEGAFRIVAMDSERSTIYEAPPDGGDWTARDYRLVTRFQDQIRRAGKDPSAHPVRDALVSPIICHLKGRTQVLPAEMLPEGTLTFITSTLLSIQGPKDLEKVEHAGPYSIYRIGPPGASISIELHWIVPDAPEAPSRQVVKVLSVTQP